MAKKLMLSIVILLLCVGGAIAQPRITFEVTSIDLGTVPRGFNTLFEYPFTNTGDSTLVIANTKSSCGCVVPMWSHEPIPPGGKGVIKAQYDSNRIGSFVKSLSVQTNDPQQPVVILYLKGQVFDTPRLDIMTLADGSPTPLAFEDVDGQPCRDSEMGNRPCIQSPARSGPRLLLVHNPSKYAAASMDLCSYNAPQEGHFGIFFCPVNPFSARPDLEKWNASPFNPAVVKAGWGSQFTDHYHLPPDGMVYLVILDVDWLTSTIFVQDLAEWAIPMGVENAFGTSRIPGR